MDQRTEILMMMHKALHLRDDIDRLYVSRKEGRKGLASTQDNIDAFIQWQEDDIKKHKGRLIAVTRNNTDNTNINWTKITRKQKWEEKQLYGHFKQQTSEISHDKSWILQRKGNLKRETKSVLRAAQNNAIKSMSKWE